MLIILQYSHLSFVNAITSTFSGNLHTELIRRAGNFFFRNEVRNSSVYSYCKYVVHTLHSGNHLRIILDPNLHTLE